MLIRDCCCAACGASYRLAWTGTLRVRCRHCGTEVVELGATATGENAETTDQKQWRFAAVRPESSWITNTGQLSLLPAPTVVVEFDPHLYFWEDDLRVGAFVAWAPSLPAIGGIGSSGRRAVADLANELHDAAPRHAVIGGDVGPTGQLLLAARQFESDQLVDYLCDLAAPPTLSSVDEPIVTWPGGPSAARDCATASA